jgi:hypothetical protein
MKDGTLLPKFIASLRNIQKHMSIASGLPEGAIVRVVFDRRRYSLTLIAGDAVFCLANSQRPKTPGRVVRVVRSVLPVRSSWRQ